MYGEVNVVPLFPDAVSKGKDSLTPSWHTGYSLLQTPPFKNFLASYFSSFCLFFSPLSLSFSLSLYIYPIGFLNVGGPLLGTAKVYASLMSGEMRDTAMLGTFNRFIGKYTVVRILRTFHSLVCVEYFMVS